MRRPLSLAAALLAVTGTLLTHGCGGALQQVGAFLDDGFHPIGDQYRVRYESERFLLPVRWRLTNYSNPAQQSGTARQDGRFFSYYSFTDASPGTPATRVPLSDLRFEMDSSASAIWCRSIILDDRWSQAPLAEFVVASIEGRAGAPSVFGHRQGQAGSYVLDEQRHAFVGGRRGRAVFFHERPGPQPPRRGVVVIVDTQRTYDTPERSFPLALVLGLQARDEVWDARLADFEALARRVDFPPP